MKWGAGLLTVALLAIGACSEKPSDSNLGGYQQQQCPAGAILCGAACTNNQADPLNCGACGNVCGAGLVCSLGQCSATCAAGLTQCGGACEDLHSSFQNCGACGVNCGAGTCSNGVCQTAQGTGGGVGTGGAVGVGGAVGTGATAGTGGAVGVGGAVGTGGTVNNGTEPLGWWKYDSLHGCAWTGVDATGVGTTVAPQDFKARAATDAYCAKGSVGAHPDYESVALLGFNLNEDPATADCSYDPAASTSAGPPGIKLTGTGIAANIVKQGSNTSFTFRVQLQGQDGATNAEHRWCATITETQGKIFVPYTDFYTECWGTTAATKGKAYAGEDVSAVVFLVPGEPTAIPYDFCVNGFAPGNSADDAPDGPAEIGDQTGTVGVANLSPDGDFRRAKVVVGGEQYIIQNTNWGNPQGTDLILNYVNNSFTITSGSGSSPGGGVPASFPSIYIGANGETANGVYATKGTDNLPKQISTISSIQTKFAWSGSTSSFNATYDVWFAKQPPTAVYQDGIDGFIMVWAHDPADAQPIGSQVGTATIAGRSWQIWKGPRGAGPNGSSSNAPVVSFVATQDIPSMSFNLLDFIKAAQAHGIEPSWYLTDVFFGFEIWNGGAGGNLKVDEFTCVVE